MTRQSDDEHSSSSDYRALNDDPDVDSEDSAIKTPQSRSSLARRSRVGKKAELVATALAATATKGSPAEQSSVRTGRTKKKC